MKPVLVLATCPEEALAQRISTQLVEEKLAACVHVTPPVQSFYRWEGRIHKETEVQMWIKTHEDLFERVSQKIRALHPFQVPEILSIPIQDGYREYLTWMQTEMLEH